MTRYFEKLIDARNGVALFNGVAGLWDVLVYLSKEGMLSERR